MLNTLFRRTRRAAKPATLAIADHYQQAFTHLQDHLTWMKEPVFATQDGRPATSLYALERILALNVGPAGWRGSPT